MTRMPSVKVMPGCSGVTFGLKKEYFGQFGKSPSAMNALALDKISDLDRTNNITSSTPNYHKYKSPPEPY